MPKHTLEEPFSIRERYEYTHEELLDILLPLIERTGDKDKANFWSSQPGAGDLSKESYKPKFFIIIDKPYKAP